MSKTPHIHDRLAVAPMMGRTDRHCRAFHRMLAPGAMLYTEMVTANAVVHGRRAVLLGSREQNENDFPVTLQLGGGEPAPLFDAVRIANDFGYAGYNLNIGCPSSRVQEGGIGACLMAEPRRVAELARAMIKAAGAKPVSVKCRIGIDDMPPTGLDDFLHAIADAGVQEVIIHARYAMLGGLSPKENRAIPPLDYDRVRRARDDFPHLAISINGGIAEVAAAQSLAGEFAGVMIGRAAYEKPFTLAEMAAAIYGTPAPDRFQIAHRMAEYAGKVMESDRNGGGDGVKLTDITRHMLGLMAGLPGARGWRHALSVAARGDDKSPDLIIKAAETVRAQTASHRLAA